MKDTELEDIDKTDIIEYLYRRPRTCEFCEKAREKGIITLEEIHQHYCEYCNRCEGCEYVFNCSECPYGDYNHYCDGFSQYLYSKPYVDGSCGLEFPMGNFRDFKTLRKALIAVHNEYSDYMSPFQSPVLGVFLCFFEVFKPLVVGEENFQSPVLGVFLCFGVITYLHIPEESFQSPVLGVFLCFVLDPRWPD